MFTVVVTYILTHKIWIIYIHEVKIVFHSFDNIFL